jgi:hypothetical protein
MLPIPRTTFFSNHMVKEYTAKSLKIDREKVILKMELRLNLRKGSEDGRLGQIHSK